MESLYLHLIDVKLNIKDNVVESLQDIGMEVNGINVGITVYGNLAIVLQISVTIGRVHWHQTLIAELLGPEVKSCTCDTE